MWLKQEEVFPCQLCDYRATRKSFLAIHLESSHNNQHLSIKLSAGKEKNLQKLTMTKDQYSKLSETKWVKHQNAKPTESTTATKQKERASSIPTRSENIKENFICTHCDFKTLSKFALLKHSKRRHAEKLMAFQVKDLSKEVFQNYSVDLKAVPSPATDAGGSVTEDPRPDCSTLSLPPDPAPAGQEVTTIWSRDAASVEMVAETHSGSSQADMSAMFDDFQIQNGE